MCNYYRLLLAAALLISIIGAGSAQTFDPRNPDDYGRDNSGFGRDTLPQGEVELDTFKVFYFNSSFPFREKIFSDTSLTSTFHQQDPARRREWDYQNLGVPGSAAQPLIYEPVFRRGLDIGFHQFDLYAISADSVPHYRLERAFTKVEYFQGAEQPNGIFTAQFSRNFANGLNVSLDYDRISYTGDDVQFPNQNARYTAMGIGFDYQSNSGRYRALFDIAYNKSEQEDNGGLSAPPQEGGEFDTPSSAQVFLNSANTRHRSTEFQYTHYFSLSKPPAKPAPQKGPLQRMSRSPLMTRPMQADTSNALRPDSLVVSDSLQIDSLQLKRPDSLALADSLQLDSSQLLLLRDTTTARTFIFKPKQAFWLAHSISYLSGSYKFFDDTPDDGEDYYGSFYTDSRGLRQYIGHRAMENHFRLLTFKPETTTAVEPARSRGLLELGLLHRLHWLDQEVKKTTVNNLFLTGRWHYLPTDQLRLETYGHFGLLDNGGDYRVEGKVTFDFKKAGVLKAELVNQLYEPGLIEQEFFVSQRQLWDNDFKKVLATSLKGTYALPSIKASVTVGYHLLNNYVYYDSTATVQQTGTPVSIGQLLVQKDFTVGKFHLDNQVALQQISEDFLRLPEVFAKHSLYFEGPIFQVLLTRLGFDLRYNTAYKSATYFPVTGNFQLQNSEEVALYPGVDAFLSLRVTKFRAFLKMENITSFVRTDELFYQTALYPYANSSRFRIGISWRFTD